MSRIGICRRLAFGRYSVVELPEPADIALWGDLVLYLSVLVARKLLQPYSAPRVVAYAIECVPPADKVVAKLDRWRPGVRFVASWIARSLFVLLCCAFDRIIFGTDVSRDVYTTCLRPRIQSRLVARSEVILALPCRARDFNPERPKGRLVVFAGALEARKGVPELLRVWRIVESLDDSAELEIIGDGPLRDEVREEQRHLARLMLSINPSREYVLARFQIASVVVLLSQRTRQWREQVGLSIIEGLSYGREILTTTETGLASWLRKAGHAVVSPTDDERRVAELLVYLLDHGRSPEEVAAALPVQDGRALADLRMREVGR